MINSLKKIREKIITKTGKVIVVHEDTLEGGIGGEIAAWIGEHCFTSLDAPVMRVGSLDTPIPFNADLEINFMLVILVDIILNLHHLQLISLQ